MKDAMTRDRAAMTLTINGDDDVPMFEWPDWQRDAACRTADVEVFFRSPGYAADEAKAICRRCPVQSECLEYALEERINFGIWGGATERDRRRIRRERGQSTRARYSTVAR